MVTVVECGDSVGFSVEQYVGEADGAQRSQAGCIGRRNSVLVQYAG